MKHVQLKTIQLKNHPELTERWLQDIIADNPSILGIGDVILKDKERIHQSAGRLDLLRQDADGSNRYEVEIQLEATVNLTSLEQLNTGILKESATRNTTTQL